MSDKKPADDFKQRLARLEAARGKPSVKSQSAKNASDKATGIGFRVASDLLAGVLVGLGVGWLLDHWLGTGPWMLVVFFFLGAMAGMMNVWRLLNGYGIEVGYFNGGKKNKDRD
ncbi:MAG: AtpZ/AtpI family protein [Candidatus Pacebacteria bacterium]|nr:AtpZ/AtpI family protein [Candidatus Paceibacterota bacterium]